MILFFSFNIILYVLRLFGRKKIKRFIYGELLKFDPRSDNEMGLLTSFIILHLGRQLN